MNIKRKTMMFVPILLLLIFLSTTKTQAVRNSACKVGNIRYSNLQAAITDIEDHTRKGTIVITSDSAITKPIQLQENSENEPLDITIDLNGYKIVNDINRTDEYSVINIGSNVNFCLKDSVGTGMLYSQNKKCSYIGLFGGTFTMDGGTILIDVPDSTSDSWLEVNSGIRLKSGIYHGNGGTIRAYYPINVDEDLTNLSDKSITINDGAYEAIKYTNLNGNVVAHINGGEFTNIASRVLSDYQSYASTYEWFPAINIRQYENIASNIYIKSGTFCAQNKAIIYELGTSMEYQTTESKLQLLKENNQFHIPENYAIYTATGDTTEFGYSYSSFTDGYYIHKFEVNSIVSISGVIANASLDPCEGQVNETCVKVEYDSKYGNLPTPTRKGYKFLGWYTSPTNGSKVAATTKVTQATDHTLYAHWAPLTVTLNPCGGKTSKKSVDAHYNRTYGKLPTPTRTGYTFLGWYTNPTNGSKITANTFVTKTMNHELYAHWKLIVVKIGFNTNSGNKLSKNSILAKYNSKLGSLPTAQRKNYLFSGWYTRRSGGNKITYTTVSRFITATTLYAHWTKVSVNKATISSLTSKSKKITIAGKKVSGAKGYQIMMATNSKFTKGVKNVTVTATKKTIKKLKKGRKYYVRIRAYKIDSTKAKVYGSWSTIKKIVIK